jgi:hypothetical protein
MDIEAAQKSRLPIDDGGVNASDELESAMDDCGFLRII